MNNLRLDKFLYDIVETSAVSKYFRADVPDYFYFGKNKILISPINLKNDSEIYLNFLQNDENLLEYKITNFVDTDFGRLIIIELSEKNLPGNIEVFIAGTNKFNKKILWKKTVIFRREEIIEEIPIFEFEPIVRISEFTSSVVENLKRDVILNNDSPERLFYYNNRNSAKLQENIILLSDRIDTFQQKTSVSNNEMESTSTHLIHRNEEFDVITCTSDYFIPEMRGGIFTCEITGGVFYSSSIVNVVNSRAVQVFPPLLYVVNDDIINSFVGKNNITASYFEYNNQKTTEDEKSYANIEINRMSPILSKITGVEIKITPIGQDTPEKTVTVPAKDANLLVANSMDNRKTSGFYELGVFDSISSVSTYWSASSVNYNTQSYCYYTGSVFAAFVSKTGSFTGHDQYTLFQTQQSYDFIPAKNCIYRLRFKYSFEKNLDFADPILDIYISGSSIEKPKNLENKLPLLYENSIGSVFDKNNGTRELEFTTIDSRPSKILFAARSGNWFLWDIRLYSDNHLKFLIPMPSIKKQNQEYRFELSYLNGSKKSRTSNVLTGLIFSGSNYNLLETAGTVYENGILFRSGSHPTKVITPVSMSYKDSGSFKSIETRDVRFVQKFGNEDTNRIFTASLENVILTERFLATPFKPDVRSCSFDNLLSMEGRKYRSGDLVSFLINFHHLTSATFGGNYSSSISESYVWGQTISVKGAYNALDASGEQIYFYKHASASATDTLERFGTVWPGGLDPYSGSKTDRDAWLTIQSITANTSSLKYTYLFHNQTIYGAAVYTSVRAEILKNEYKF